MATPLKRLFLSLLVALPLGCGGASPIPRTIDDVARIACEAYFSQHDRAKALAMQQGISIDDAAKAICAVADVLAPFVRAEQAGIDKAGPEAEGAALRVGIPR